MSSYGTNYTSNNNGSRDDQRLSVLVEGEVLQNLSEDDNLSEEVSSTTAKSIKYKKYRPITQSIYGIYHHKKQGPPSFDLNQQGIRDQTLALNQVGLLATTPNSNNFEDSYFSNTRLSGVPLRQFNTLDETGSYGHKKYDYVSENEDGFGSEHPNTHLTSGSELLRNGQFNSFLKNYNNENSGNTARPSKAFGQMFGRRASSLFDNFSVDEERKSLLSNHAGIDNSIGEEGNNNFYHTFNTQIENNLEDSLAVKTEKAETLIPTPDYSNMNWLDYLLLPITFFPPVFLGLILNFLNAVSYGMIIFPTQIPIFATFGPDGISMFLVSSSTQPSALDSLVGWLHVRRYIYRSQPLLIYLLVVPFLHIICQTIIDELGVENEAQIVATTMVAYALSSIVTGIVFFLLGYFKLGNLVGFFPRHILVGCIGGVGYFLMQTALETVTRIKLSYFSLDGWYQFLQPQAIGLWATSVLLASSLKLLQRRINSPILLPAFYLSIPVVFFTIVHIFNLDLDYLREIGWLFARPDTSKPFYNFYLHFDLYNTSWSTLPKLLPIILALTFFGILHVPINVPAVAVTTKTDVYDVNFELIGHGWSNTLSGLCGSLQNYLMYSSSVLFFKSGGNDRAAGLLLAILTATVWTMGPGIVGYIPCVVVGSLIFHLGLELFKEGVYETWSVMNRLEYATIWVIVVAMALLGFVEGVFVGIVLACLFFVYVYSLRAPIRSAYSGIATRSSVRRVLRQRQYLDLVSTQTQVLKLQGFMFFGTIDQVESYVRNLLDSRSWSNNPIRFVVFDLTLVTGVDFSAAEAFIRIRRLLSSRQVHGVYCGLSTTSEVGLALHAVGLWSNKPEDLTNIFPTLNGALEWCENTLLQLSYLRTSQNRISIPSTTAPTDIINRNRTMPYNSEVEQMGSPRTHLLDLAASESLLLDSQQVGLTLQQPLALLVQILASTSQTGIDDDLFKLAKSFHQQSFAKNTTLWEQNDPADRLYLVESGLLKAYLQDPNLTTTATNQDDFGWKEAESILPGTMVGELATFTGRTRPFRVKVELDATLWCLTKQEFERLKLEEPQLTIKLMSWCLNFAANDITVYAKHTFGL